MGKEIESPAEDIGKLKADVARLEQRVAVLEKEKEELIRLNTELDEQNANFMNTAVTFHRLYSSKNYAELVGIIKEILINMVGAKQFEIYVVDKNKKSLILITREGKKSSATPEAQQLVRRVMKKGEVYVASEEAIARKEHPICGIPLKVENEVLGMILLNELLVQKTRIQQQDRELFGLLGKYAATAIYFTKLNWIFESEIQRKLREGTVDLTPPTLASMKSIVSNLLDKNH